LYCILIFYLSSRSKINIPIHKANIDKILHFLEYAILGILSFRAFYNIRKKLDLPIIFIIFYSISDELHQSFIPGRDASFYDALADILGGIFGIIFFKLWKEKLKRKANFI